ncbi:tRNA lysidine(34) synthetase TilS [Nocardiopsis coralliicola]
MPPGALVLVACSGGAASLALAGAAAFAAPRMGLRAGAVTVDHGLQDGSAGRARAAAAQLEALGLDPVAVETVQVGDSGGPEGAARDARYAALDAAAHRLGAAALLLGHTADDQAETVLLGLARGSGARSLSGMAPRSGNRLRPFLGLPRATVRRACAEMGLVHWEDPHNADPAFARSRVRHAALPALEAALGPGAAAALARTAGLLRDDADALDAWAQRAAADCAVPPEAPGAAAAGAQAGPPGAAERGVSSPGPRLDAAALAALPRAVRTRVMRSAALAAGSPAGDLSAAHVAELDRLVADWRGQTHIDLPGGLRARRRGGAVEFGA